MIATKVSSKITYFRKSDKNKTNKKHQLSHIISLHEFSSLSMIIVSYKFLGQIELKQYLDKIKKYNGE